MNEIELVCDSWGSWRHQLNGRDIHSGDQLQIFIGGNWLYVRYEASFVEGKLRPIFLALGGRIVPDDDSNFRWKEGE